MDSSEQLLWSVQVDHQLFALQKLDVTVSLGSCLQNKIPHMANVWRRFLFSYFVLFLLITIFQTISQTIKLCRSIVKQYEHIFMHRIDEFFFY